MRQGAMIIIFSVFILLYGAVNWYVYSRGVKALEETNTTKIFTWIYWILTASFILGQFLERGNPGTFSRIISLSGSIWLAFFLYALLLVLAIDIVRLANHFFHFIPSGVLSGKMLFIYGVTILLSITIYGYINAWNPRIKEVNISLNKKQSTADNLKVVFVSDVHLGVLLRNKKADQLLKDINAQNADLVLFGGDLVDHNPVPVVENDMGKYFQQINAPLGVYAITGNHEFIGHVEVSVNYFSEHGVTYLRDTIQTIAGIIQIVGRDDRSSAGYNSNGRRKTMEELLKDANPDLPLLLLDHQPVEYDFAKQLGVDLMMSGHTHKGQLWPLGYITKSMFENDYGLYEKEGTLFYTSSGYGTWGPPVRTGNRPELVVFNITFK